MSRDSYQLHVAISQRATRRRVVLMFERHWVEPVRSGRKVQTLRPPRKWPAHVGDQLSLRHWGGRPGSSVKEVILTTQCTSVFDVVIDDGGMEIVTGAQAGKRLGTEQCAVFARRDGFASFEAMQKYFRERYGLPFSGTVIGWD